METSMLNARNKSCTTACDNAHTISELIQFLENPIGRNFLKENRREGWETGQNIRHYIAIDESGNEHIIFENEDLLRVLIAGRFSLIESSLLPLPVNLKDISKILTIFISDNAKVIF